MHPVVIDNVGIWELLCNLLDAFILDERIYEP
jgi:hypothetical protein